MRNLLLSILLFIPGLSFAESYIYQIGGFTSKSSALDVCQMLVTSQGRTGAGIMQHPNGPFCYFNNDSSNGLGFVSVTVDPNPPPPPPACTPDIRKNFNWPENAPKPIICYMGCTYRATGTQVYYSGGGAGTFKSSESACSGSDTGTPDPGTCPSGTHNISSIPTIINCTADKPPAPKCWVGSTNVSADPEVAVCVADGTPKTGPDDPNSHSPDPSKPPVIKTTNVVEPMSDGGVKTTTTTTTTTTNTDGSTTITSDTKTTTIGPDGKTETTTDKNKAEDKTKSFCELNPQLTICRNSTVSGDCDTLAIDGDAIQGAILRQQKKEYCENNAASAIKDLGIAILANNDPMKSQFPSIDNASVVDLSNIGNLDSSGFLGGGSCFADKSFNISGIAVRIPISVVCDYLIPLRLAIMLLALMASYKMVAGTVLRDL